MTDNVQRGCAVRGVAGFVESRLAERLLAMGCTVVGEDNFFAGRLHSRHIFAKHRD
ncbi:MAG: hypothetical protein WAW37_17925 [Syntrophobacteraceae bacterium]